MSLVVMRKVDMSDYTNILVAIDFDAEHESVVRRALSIAKSPQDVSLVYVSLPSVYIQPYLYGMPEYPLDDTDLMAVANKRLQKVAVKFGIAEEKTYVKSGVVADEIQSVANDNDVDLIVIGTHGRSGIKLLLGATANSVLHGVKQDVLAVRMSED